MITEYLQFSFFFSDFIRDHLPLSLLLSQLGFPPNCREIIFFLCLKFVSNLTFLFGKLLQSEAHTMSLIFDVLYFILGYYFGYYVTLLSKLTNFLTKEGGWVWRGASSATSYLNRYRAWSKMGLHYKLRLISDKNLAKKRVGIKGGQATWAKSV